MILLALALACAPKPAAPVSAPASVPAPAPPPDPNANLPAPLADRPFTVPEAAHLTLSNGLHVVVVENHEVPMVWGTLAFLPGGWTDPEGKEGRARATMDLMLLGAGKLDSMAISGALRKLGSGMDSDGDLDGASLSFNTLTRNLDPTLDLVTAVLTKPTFPQKEWEFLRGQYLDRLERTRNDPTQVASRVLWHVVQGSRYRGRMESEASLRALTLADMKAFHATLAPQQALLLLGGDLTADGVKDTLERHLGAWRGQPIQAAPIFPKPEPMATSIQLVDFPQKAQSVVRMATWIGAPTDADYYPFRLADTAIGGQFTARINMNLREEKGFTYGARSSTWYDLMGAWWTFNAGIQTPHTAEAIAEVVKELQAPSTGRPVTDTELRNAKGSLVQSYPLAFENTGYLLGQELDEWRYHLGDDWVGAYIPRVEAVDLAAANGTWSRKIDAQHVVIVVAGDAAVVRPELEKLGYPIVERTPDGDLRTH